MNQFYSLSKKIRPRISVFNIHVDYDLRTNISNLVLRFTNDRKRNTPQTPYTIYHTPYINRSAKSRRKNTHIQFFLFDFFFHFGKLEPRRLSRRINLGSLIFFSARFRYRLPPPNFPEDLIIIAKTTSSFHKSRGVLR